MCKMGKCFRFVTLLLTGILCIGCGGTSDANSPPTVTPTQASALGEHTENPHIRGIILDIFTQEGNINGIYIEEIAESDTEYDKAFVGITDKTRIYLQTDTGYAVTALDQLTVGVKVEVLFVGLILEIYPIRADAAEIMIVP